MERRTETQVARDLSGSPHAAPEGVTEASRRSTMGWIGSVLLVLTPFALLGILFAVDRILP